MQQNHPVETRQIPSTNALIYWTNHIYSKKPILPQLWLMQSYCKKITESDIAYLKIIFLGTNLKSWAISILFFVLTRRKRRASDILFATSVDSNGFDEIIPLIPLPTLTFWFLILNQPLFYFKLPYYVISMMIAPYLTKYLQCIVQYLINMCANDHQHWNKFITLELYNPGSLFLGFWITFESSFKKFLFLC